MMQRIQAKHGVYLLTVDMPDGYEVVEYYGLVTGNAIIGANLLKDFFARVRDSVGGRVKSYEASVDSAIANAVEDMARRASALGANAILGLELDTGAAGHRGMLTASCSGTAAEIRKRSST